LREMKLLQLMNSAISMDFGRKNNKGRGTHLSLG
jgi:hypothetical protein